MQRTLFRLGNSNFLKYFNDIIIINNNNKNSNN
jgi:hypothetical protein